VFAEQVFEYYGKRFGVHEWVPKATGIIRDYYQERAKLKEVKNRFGCPREFHDKLD